MKEIKVGEYIRTKQGEIAKIIDTNIFDKTIYKNVQGAKYYLEDITKHSSNIIDLIEVGDYVNGVEVIHFQDDIFNSYYELANHFLVSRKKPEDIKSIVTKEQFQSVMYEV